jgi:hypothetical protein
LGIPHISIMFGSVKDTADPWPPAGLFNPSEGTELQLCGLPPFALL